MHGLLTKGGGIYDHSLTVIGVIFMRTLFKALSQTYIFIGHLVTFISQVIFIIVQLK